MGDIYVNEQISFRIVNHGLPNVEHRIVIFGRNHEGRRAGESFVSEPLSDVHLGILGTQATGAYFARTGRPVWPVIDHGGQEALADAAAAYEAQEVLDRADQGVEGALSKALGTPVELVPAEPEPFSADPNGDFRMTGEDAPFVPAYQGAYDLTTQPFDEPFRHVDPAPVPSTRRRVV